MPIEGVTFALVCTQVLATENKDKMKLTDSSSVEAPGGGFSMIYGADSASLVEPCPQAKRVYFVPILMCQRMISSSSRLMWLGTTYDLIY